MPHHCPRSLLYDKNGGEGIGWFLPPPYSPPHPVARQLHSSHGQSGNQKAQTPDVLPRSSPGTAKALGAFLLLKASQKDPRVPSLTLQGPGSPSTPIPLIGFYKDFSLYKESKNARWGLRSGGTKNTDGAPRGTVYERRSFSSN